MSKLKNNLIIIFLLDLVVGCVASPPMPLQLVDSASRMYSGTLNPDSQKLEVTIDGHLFRGVFIVGSGSAVSETLSGRRYLPGETVTYYTSNSARAHLTSDNGKQLNCEFLYEVSHAIGECKSPSGAVFQLSADDNSLKNR